MTTDNDAESAFDPKRRLCPDGSCIGIVGPDGRCTVCGRAAPGQPGQASAAAALEPDELGADEETFDPSSDDAREPGETGETGATFDPQRRLCSDGACIGVIGKNNRCQVCGRPA